MSLASIAALTACPLALATMVSIAPVLLTFLFSQRFLVEGMTAGGAEE